MGTYSTVPIVHSEEYATRYAVAGHCLGLVDIDE